MKSLIHSFRFAYLVLTLLGAMVAVSLAAETPATGVVDSLTFNGQVDPQEASFVLKGHLIGKGGETPEPKLIYSLHATARHELGAVTNLQRCELRARLYQGKLKELVLAMKGDGLVTGVTGATLRDWSVRHGEGGQRFLVLRPQETAVTNQEFQATVEAVTRAAKLPATLSPLVWAPETAALFEGVVEVVAAPEIAFEVETLSGLAPLQADPAPAVEPAAPTASRPLRLRFSGSEYGLTLRVREADPEARKVAWEEFQLDGTLSDKLAAFTLRGVAVVKHPAGGRLEVLSGDAALTAYPPGAELIYTNGAYVLVFRREGRYPLELPFNARVRAQDGWNGVRFGVAPSALRPVTLRGLAAEVQLEWGGAARPERRDDALASYLPAAGPVELRWKAARAEEEGKLFYTVEGASQIAVGPGLLRQAHLLEFKVMQGEMTRLTCELAGEGEVTRILGEGILTWRVEAGTNQAPRRLVVQFNQARKDQGSVVVQTQTPLGVFPLPVRPLRLVPVDAVRFGGHLLVVNDGAVRLEVTEARGLSQISPDLFPRTKELASVAPAQRTQAFAYRFSGADFALSVQADHIQPEISLSQLLVYHLGETELVIEGEFELDIREAPLRELVLRVPADYTVSQLTVPGLSDYFVSPEAVPGWASLKLVFTQPVAGRLVAQLRLEKNQTLSGTTWRLPPLEAPKVKSARGYVGVTADMGLRLAAGQLEGLSEIATALFPRKVPGLQLAYRLREGAWQASLAFERLALSLQVDACHLFSISDGIAYGSSVLNYLISGAPVAVLKIAAPPEYGNVEFAGRDLRHWKKTDTGYEVYLHTPVFGAYSLLATYDRKFKTAGEVLTLTGLSPQEVQSDQGIILVVSEYQFQVKPAEPPRGVLGLDPAEIPTEHRLLFDAPILAAYQYTARPGPLRLELSALAQGDAIQQVIDRAAFLTHVSREGEVVTTAQYYVKSKGQSHARFTLPEGVQLWEAQVNGVKAAPVADGRDALVPLPARRDPSAILNVTLHLAAQSPKARAVRVAMPAAAAPVLFTEWRIEPDQDYHLDYRGGSVAPQGLGRDRTGFAWLWRLVRGGAGTERQTLFFGGLLGVLLAAWLGRLATGAGVYWLSLRHLVTGLLGLLVLGVATWLWLTVAWYAAHHPFPLDSTLVFQAPVQAAGQALTVDVRNRLLEEAGPSVLRAWPAVLGVILWLYALLKLDQGLSQRVGWLVGWLLMGWTALRWPNGMPALMGVLLVFLLVQVVIPSLRAQWRLPRKPTPAPSPAAGGAVSLGLVLGLSGALGVARAAETAVIDPGGVVQSVIQQIQVTNGHALAKAQVHWRAAAGQTLDLLRAPAVLTAARYPQPALRMSETRVDGRAVHRLTAGEAGTFTVEFDYQLPLGRPGQGTNGFALPTPAGLAQQVTLTIDRAEVEVLSTNAVSIQTQWSKRPEGDATRSVLVLAPEREPWIGWQPRARDTSLEKAVFYAELAHVFIPAAGVVEGVCEVQVRPAQGQLTELTCGVPAGFTVTDVEAEFVAGWRFDPDQRRLRIQFRAAQARPFAVRVRGQMAASPLPYQQAVGMLSVGDAAGQVGMAGVATGPEVQLEQVQEAKLSPINLEDFPAALLADLAKQTPGLALRRAFRFAESNARLTLNAAAVQPDVRVQTQETLSLGEDRTVLAAQWTVQITRAGIFKLSFALPAEFEVEALSGAALSHWTELKSDAERVVTLHLRGRTEGEQKFNLSLAGPGLLNRKEWDAPRLVLREANKQSGQLVLVPELGLRLQVKTREGVAQLDVQQLGLQQKGVLAFRLLHAQWRLGFDLETVEPWIQVTHLQDVTVREGQLQVVARLDYQIDNAGVKALAVQLPARAEGVRFEGDYIADSIRQDPGTAAQATWNLKLQRRIIGAYALKILYQMTAPSPPSELTLAGVKAGNANLQRGYLAVRTAGRLQVQIPQVPPALQRTEWSSIPASLRRGLPVADAKDAFRLVETDYQLPLRLIRHEMAKVLPARVERVELTSVVSADGEMLTEARLTVRPGDKRLLRLKLPAASRFWYAFVNQESAWPWREAEQILLMLEKNSDANKPTLVEFFYTDNAARQPGRGFTHRLAGPQFDLPLENISWQVYVPATWDLEDWHSTLRLESETGQLVPVPVTVTSYLENEAGRQREQTKEAESLLLMGNDYLQRGVPQQARKAYQAAWRLSQHDAAFNEDARVQWQNLKLQQALLGLSQRRQLLLGQRESREGQGLVLPAPGAAPDQAPAYTQQQARQILQQNSNEENAALAQLAERLIRQQDAALAKPEALRAALPRQGKLFNFSGSLQVATWTDLDIQLDTVRETPHGGWLRLASLVALLGFLLILAAVIRRPAAV